MEMDLIRINRLKTHFFQGKGLLSRLLGQGLRTIHAVDGVSFSIRKGRIFGLVGESGCGKSTLGQTIFRLVEPIAGEIWFKDTNVLDMDFQSLRKFRQKAQMIFQDQYGCLNPRMTVGQIIAEPLELQPDRYPGRLEIENRVVELLQAVDMDPESAMKFPNEFSGGQARRIGVARAIALNPDFIVADEPTSGLDISTAATVLNLMKELQERFDLTYLWISHNLNQVRYLSDDIAIMYLGKIVETGPTTAVFENMAHPYSQALISAVPQIAVSRRKELIPLEGEIPSPINPPSGCRFRTRCPYVKDICSEVEPTLKEVEPGHFSACHLQAEESSQDHQEFRK